MHERFGDALLPLKLDVNDRAADFAAVELAAKNFRRLDVVVNNAGYGQFGMIEEICEGGGYWLAAPPCAPRHPFRAALGVTRCASRSRTT